MLLFHCNFLVVFISFTRILECLTSLEGNPEKTFLSVSKIRQALRIVLMKHTFNEGSAMDYYSSRHWDADDGYSPSSLHKLWKDDDIVVNGSHIHNLCFSRLAGYTDNGVRISAQVSNPLRIWSSLVKFKSSTITSSELKPVIFVNFVAQDKRNPYWFWNPRYLYAIGGGVEAFITSIPTHIPPIDHHFRPAMFQRSNVPPPKAYNVLAFPIVPGGTYHLEFRTLKDSTWRKQLQILPASLHDVALTLERNRPTLRSESQFESIRRIRNGSIFISLEKEEQKEEQTTWQSTASDSVSMSGMTPNAVETDLGDEDEEDVDLHSGSNLQLKEKLLFNHLISLTLGNLYQKRRQLISAVDILRNRLPEVSVRQMMRRLAARNLLFNKKNLKENFASEIASSTRLSTPKRLLDYLEDVVDKHDWVSAEQLESYRAQALYNELATLAKQRYQILFILFEPFMVNYVNEAFQQLDNRTLRMMRTMSLRRLWRGFLIALEKLSERKTSAHGAAKFCNSFSIHLINGTKIKASLRDLTLPSNLGFKLTELQDEHSTLCYFKERYGLPESFSEQITQENQWIIPYCSEATSQHHDESIMTVNQQLKSLSRVTDPASVLAILVRPLLFTERNLVLHGVILAELLRRYPESEYLTKHTDQNILFSQLEFVKIVQDFDKLKTILAREDQTLIQFISSWHNAFLQSLAVTLLRASDPSRVIENAYPPPAVKISGFIPHLPDYFSLDQNMVLVDERASGTSPFDEHMKKEAKNEPTRSETDDEKNYQIYSLLLPNSTTRLNHTIISHFRPLQKLLNQFMEKKIRSCEEGLTPQPERLELRISAFHLASIKNVADIIVFFNKTRFYQNKQIQNLQINLTVTDVFGFPKVVGPFFELVHFQKLRQMESNYAKKIMALFPRTFFKKHKIILNRLRRYRSSPIFSDTTQKIPWFPLFGSPLNQWSVKDVKNFCSTHHDALGLLPHVLGVRVEKFLYLQDMLKRLNYRLRNSSLFGDIKEIQDAYLREFQKDKRNLSHLVFFSEPTSRESDLEWVIKHEEDFQRIFIQDTVTVKKKVAAGDHHETPLWDVRVVSLDKLYPGTPPVTFLINERHPYSYFFKGRSNRYEPQGVLTLSRFFMLKRAYSLLLSDKRLNALSDVQYSNYNTEGEEGQNSFQKRRKVGCEMVDRATGQCVAKESAYGEALRKKVRLRNHRYGFPKETDFRVAFQEPNECFEETAVNAVFLMGGAVNVFSSQPCLTEGNSLGSRNPVTIDECAAHIPNYPHEEGKGDGFPLGLRRVLTPPQEKQRYGCHPQGSSYLHSSASTTVPSASWDEGSHCGSLVHQEPGLESLLGGSSSQTPSQKKSLAQAEEGGNQGNGIFWPLRDVTHGKAKNGWRSSNRGSASSDTAVQESSKRKSSAVRVSAFRIDGGYIITPGNHRVLINQCMMNADHHALKLSQAAIRPAAAALATYAHDMYIKWRLLEEKIDNRTFQLSFRPRSDLERFRQMALQCILHCAATTSLSFPTLHSSVHNVHRILLHYVKQKKVRLTASMFFGTLAACLRMALKHEETPEVLRPFRESSNSVWKHLGLEDHSLSHVDTAYVNTVEVDCLTILKDPLTPPSAPDYLDRYLTVGGWPSRVVPTYRELALYLTSLALFSRMEVDQLAGIRPSLIAACALSLAVKVISAGSDEGYEFWPQRLSVYSGYSIDDLRPGIRGLSTLLRRKPSGVG